MSLSIQTNVASLVAQNNLLTNTNFQTSTIEQLTSGYRINSASDDAAGLAVANTYRNNIAQLTQGVGNANDGVSQLQIIDGGVTNIGNILDRLQTLATESASQTFTGNRSTLNNEYQSLLSEIDRQAANVGLSSQANGNQFNINLGVYIGGSATQANAQVTVNLSGAQNQVDAAGLGLASTNVSAGGTELSAGTPNAINLNNSAGTFTGNQSFTFNIVGQATAVTVSTGAGNATSAAAITALNGQLSQYGLNASIAADGTLQFSGGTAFSVTASTTANGIATGASAADYNAGDYAYHGAAFTAVTAGAETESITNGQGTANLSFDTTSGASLSTAIAYMNTQLNGIGIQAVTDSAGTGFTLQSDSTFTINETATATTGQVFAAAAGAVALTNATPTSSSASALSALSSITAAVQQLGLVQGRVGAGENQLKYAIALATSQITNFDSAQSDIRDANIAQEAANLTQSQTLQQASIAAMAVANSAPQQLLALLHT